MKIDSDKWRLKVSEGASLFSIDIPDDRLKKLSDFSHELVKWNRKINLTAITDPTEIAVKHIVDSLYPLKKIEKGKRVLDLGAGGGFPSIPMGIVSDDIEFTMIESSRKKVSFLKHAVRTLKLTNIKALNMRCEEASLMDQHRHKYDFVISRAFTSLKEFIKLARPFLNETGKIIAMKGKETEDEVNSIKNLNLHYSIERYKLPFLGSDRSQIVVDIQNP